MGEMAAAAATLVMNYLVFDFETTGIGKDSVNGYKPYPTASQPLPHANYPVQLACELVNNQGIVLGSFQTLITGAERLDPWVMLNCPHLSIKDCEREGVELSEAVQRMVDMIGDEPCTLVAHNIQYDWNEVLLTSAHNKGLDESEPFRKLASCPRFCTCVNEAHKKKRSAYYFAKIGKWIGPPLEKLANSYNVEYNPSDAHDAPYDVRVTRQCLAHMLAAKLVT